MLSSASIGANRVTLQSWDGFEGRNAMSILVDLFKRLSRSRMPCDIRDDVLKDIGLTRITVQYR